MSAGPLAPIAWCVTLLCATLVGCGRSPSAREAVAVAAPPVAEPGQSAPLPAALSEVGAVGGAATSRPGGHAGHAALHPGVHGSADQPAAAPPAPAAAGGVHAHGPSGVIEASERGGGMAFLRLRTADGEAWAAVPEPGPAVGERVTIVEAVVLRDHESKALQRRFAALWLGRVDATVAPAEAVAAPPSLPAPGAGELSIAALRAAGAPGDGAVVSVRGAVVKANRRIMGKDFLHLRDDSVGADGPVLVVTTTAAVATGAVVVARGVLRRDADIGGGYRYDILLTDAAVTVAAQEAP